MKNLLKIAGASALICLCFMIPSQAQITNGVNFTTTFAFYAGNTKLPAGSYRITPATFSQSMLQIENTARTHSAFIEIVPTDSASHPTSDVTFNKYGGIDFLNRIWLGGQQYGMQLIPSNYEKKLAEGGAPQTHSVAAK
jgi:hypothetical protein